MLRKRFKWKTVEDCIYLGDNHAIVHATDAPPYHGVALKRSVPAHEARALGGHEQTVVCHIKATNSRAKLMCKQSASPHVQTLDTTNADGDDWAEHEVPQDEIVRPPEEAAASGSILDPARRRFQLSVRASAEAAASLAAASASVNKRSRGSGATPSPSTSKRGPLGGGRS